MRSVLGIDVGINGGWAWVPEEGRPVVDTYLRAGDGLDLRELAIEWGALSPTLAIVERVGAMPKQGVSSSFRFGQRFGEILGVLAALGIPYRLVRPQAWKADVLAGTPRDKAAAIEFCRQSYPDVRLVPQGKRVPHDGIADALCMAHHGWRSCIK